MAKTRDLYDVLGVPKSATEAEIRTAYKKLAAKLHPDKNPDDAAAEQRFKDVGAAYEVLSDKVKRANYDEFGDIALQSGFDADDARARRAWGAASRRRSAPRGGPPADFDLRDLFNGLDGFGVATDPRQSPGRSAPRRPRGEDVHAVAELELEDAIRGAEVAVTVPVHDPCSHCHGAGVTSAGPACERCGGSGRVRVSHGSLEMLTTCESCGGRGRRLAPCTPCGGRGHHTRTQQVKVPIPPRADDGSTLRIPGKGSGVGARGDLVIETRLRPHPRVRRDKLDLTFDLPVTLVEAYAGAKVEVPTFDGPVTVTIPPRSQSGQKLRLKGRGVKRGKERGDLYVVLDVRLPDRPSIAVENALRKESEGYSRSPREDFEL